MFADAGEGVGVAVRVVGGVLDELGLGPGAEGCGDHRAGDGGGGFGAVGQADQVQAEVDTGRGAGGGPDVVVLDEEGVRDDRDPGVTGPQEVEQAPVRDGAAAVEQPGLGEGEGASAQGGDGGAAVVGAAEGGEDRGGGRGEVVVEAGDDDEVGFREPVEGTVGVEGEAAAHRDGGGAVGGDAAQVEGGGAAVGAVGAPDLGDDGDVEGPDAGEGDEGYAVGRRRTCCCSCHGWQ